MRKVCHFTSLHRVLDQRIFSKELKTLQQSNYDVVLIAPSDKDVQMIENIKVFGFKKARNRLFRLTSWWVILKKAKKVNAEIYHFHDPDMILVGLWIKIFWGKIVIYDVHEYYPEAILTREWVPSILKTPISYLVNIIENFSARIINNIIVCDDEMEKRFKNIGCNVELVRNFIRKSDFTKNNYPANESFARTVTHLGTLTPQRGSRLIPEIVYQVSKVFPDVRFEIVDFFRERNDEYDMKELLREKQVENNVAFMPVIVSEKIGEYISRGIIGLSIYENTKQYAKGIPTKLFEYVSSGIALVASDVPIYRKFAEKASFGILINGTNPDSYANAIIELLKNPDYAIELGKTGMNSVLSQYIWENEEKKLLDFYSSL